MSRPSRSCSAFASIAFSSLTAFGFFMRALAARGVEFRFGAEPQAERIGRHRAQLETFGAHLLCPLTIDAEQARDLLVFLAARQHMVQRLLDFGVMRVDGRAVRQRD